MDWQAIQPFRDHEGDPEDLLFRNTKGGPLDNGYINDYYLAPIAKAAKVEGLTPKVTRHTYATKAAREGINPTVLASVLGHSSTRMVLEYYTSVSGDDKRKVAQAVRREPDKPISVLIREETQRRNAESKKARRGW